MKRFVPFLFIFILMMLPGNLAAFDGDMWLVTGKNVRVRSAPGIKAPVVTEVNAGLVVQVLSKTVKRDIFLPGDSYGYFWYEASLPSGKKGWIYGKFLYNMNGDNFAVDGEVFAGTYIIAGKKYLFGIAVEEAYPVGDDEGLTGSSINALPFLIEEGKNQALLFRTVSVRTFNDADMKFPYFFRLNESDGGIQQVKSIEIDEKNKKGVLKLNITFTTQTGGGNFFIRAKKDKDHMTITEYKLLNEEKNL